MENTKSPKEIFESSRKIMEEEEENFFVSEDLERDFQGVIRSFKKFLLHWVRGVGRLRD